MVIRRVGPLSVAKIGGVLYALIGLVIGLGFSLVFLIAGGSLLTQQPEAAPAGLLVGMGAGAVVVMPIVYGAMGFVATFITALLYNLASGLVGGIDIEVDLRGGSTNVPPPVG